MEEVSHFFLKYFHLLWKSISLSGLALLLIMAPLVETAPGAQIKLVWDANTEIDLAGYRVYFGTAQCNFEESITLGKVTTTIKNPMSDGGKLSQTPRQWDSIKKLVGDETPC